MINSILNSSSERFQTSLITFPGQRITWAGEGISSGSFLFGSDCGMLMESSVDGPLNNWQPIKATFEAEAVNGVAHYFVDDILHLGITTRAEIAHHSLSQSKTQIRASKIEFGAHGIHTAANSMFISPAGPSGLVSIYANEKGEHRYMALETDEGAPIYSCAALARMPNHYGELFINACRRGGLLYAMTSSGGISRLPEPIKFQGATLDFVGVVSIGWDDSPLAWVAISKGNCLHFMRDPLNTKEIDTVSFPYIPGRPYKLIRYGDHLLLLTSRGLCVIRDIVAQYIAGENIGGMRTIHFLEVDAVDMNIAVGKWLLVVVPDGVARLDLPLLLSSRKESLGAKDSSHQHIDALPLMLSLNKSARYPAEEPIWRESHLHTAELRCA